MTAEGNGNFYQRKIEPIVSVFPSEGAHIFTRELLGLASYSPPIIHRVVGKLEQLDSYEGEWERLVDDRLRGNMGGTPLENCLVVDAGWDKTGVAVAGLYELNFASIVVGSVPEFGQYGNKKSRQWVFPPGVAFQHLGFNSPGMKVVGRKLRRYMGSGIPIGVSIAVNQKTLEKGPDAVFASQANVADYLYDYYSYVVTNPSSPNSIGLRAYQSKDLLRGSLSAVNAILRKKGTKPHYVKVAPDLTFGEMDGVIEVCLDLGMTGVFIANTSLNASLKAKYGVSDRPGGISGNDPDFRGLSTKLIEHTYKQTRGTDFQIVGVGGVNNAEAAIEKHLAGASIVGLVTSLRGTGPTVAREIIRGEIEYMDKMGIKNNIDEIVGQGVK